MRKPKGRPRKSIIAEWEYNDIFGLIQYLKTVWVYADDAIVIYWTKEICHLELNTLGFSENEQLIKQVLKNSFMNHIAYKMWKTGGHYYFEINPQKLGWQYVFDFAKEIGVSKQIIHHQKHKYEWMELGNRLMVRKSELINP